MDAMKVRGVTPPHARPTPKGLQRHIQGQRALAHATACAVPHQAANSFSTRGSQCRPIVDFVRHHHTVHRIGLFRGETGPRRKGRIQHGATSLSVRESVFGQVEAQAIYVLHQTGRNGAPHGIKNEINPFASGNLAAGTKSASPANNTI
ncbi:hypothetical protein GHT06_007321 [Daphnia sinensis]|uniref:Uncharacterized protein n=1 Tax=Daphnia sinensis TaxID=1820382 RepID=A0AAD5PJS7_9CRUS|nr:hypothetical protein GHT06_007321 [Daphnia sinensis]